MAKRVLSLFFIDQGLWSLGGLLIGGAASVIGIDWTFAGCASIGAITAAALVLAAG